MTKNPWMKFYPTDWRSDPRLKMCSLAARGLWIEMIALMHESTPYGYLTISGISPTDAQLAMLIGAPFDLVPGLIGELESAGVFSRTKQGIIYSRKMIRMEKEAAASRSAGNRGGNPKLINGYTKPGYVYIIGRRDDGACKIGVSINPKNRIKKIRVQYYGHNLKILGQIWTEDMGTLERTLHETHSNKCAGGEWFQLSDSDIETITKNKDPKGYPLPDPLTQKPEARVQKERKKEICRKPPKRRFAYPPDFEKFWIDYPTTSIMSKKEAYNKFKNMDDESKNDVVRSVPLFQSYCRQNPDYPPVHACRYISQARYVGFLDGAKKIEGMCFVKKGTTQWNAMLQIKGKVSFPITEHNGDKGWSFKKTDVAEAIQSFNQAKFEMETEG